MGRDQVRGTATTRYEVKVDTGERLGLHKYEHARADLLDEAALNVWLDGDGALRRVRAWFGHEVTYEFWDLGAAVDIALPAPDQVTPLTARDEPPDPAGCLRPR